MKLYCWNGHAASDLGRSCIVNVNFGGFSIEASSEFLRIVPAAMKSRWACAPGWLFGEMWGKELRA